MAIFMHSVFSTLLSTMTFFSECFALSQRMVYPFSLVVCVRYTLSRDSAGIALLWVAALGGVVLYIYAVISFAFLHESADNSGEEDKDNDLFCETLGQCFITVIRFGLIDNLGLVGT